MLSVLAIAPHPDDETFGCGGTLLNHIQTGHAVHWLIGTRGWEPLYTPEVIRQQQEQVQAVSTAYPFASTTNLGFETTRLDVVPMNDLIDAMRRRISEVRPSIVYLPNPIDAHTDHRLVFHAAMSVMKPFYMARLGIRRILACEIPSETDSGSSTAPPFNPQVFSDISKTLERKLEIVKLFETELHAEPLPRSLTSVRALARTRGATIGVDYAESFTLIREIQ
jgi:LmbE family N-acetylglucosaminyl deacetylase